MERGEVNTMTEKFFLCPECFEKADLIEVAVTEEVTIKEDTFENTHYYMKCSNCGELFKKSNHIDRNYLSDYEIYRSRNKLLQPEEIIEIREKYELSQRQFAKILGIGNSTLSRIESGALQSEYQNSLFVLSRSPISFRNLIRSKKDSLQNKEYAELIQLLDSLVSEEIAVLT